MQKIQWYSPVLQLLWCYSPYICQKSFFFFLKNLLVFIFGSYISSCHQQATCRHSGWKSFWCLFTFSYLSTCSPILAYFNRIHDDVTQVQQWLVKASKRATWLVESRRYFNLNNRPDHNFITGLLCINYWWSEIHHFKLILVLPSCY